MENNALLGDFHSIRKKNIKYTRWRHKRKETIKHNKIQADQKMKINE